jgi:two-component system chemotaxis response regulator CheY
MGGLENLRVLLVDDNQHMRAIVMAVLVGVGVRNVREAGDGREALRDWPADVAIVDFQMSPMDGVQFTRLVRTSPDSKNPYLPVVMMTGHSEKSRVVDARDAGVTEFIAKPLTARSVLDRLQAVIYQPRPIVRSSTYLGPDRRRRDAPNYNGPWCRAGDEPRPLSAGTEESVLKNA